MTAPTQQWWGGNNVLQQWWAGNTTLQQTKDQQTVNFEFPQVSKPLPAGEQGIASISHNGRTFRFRTNPNEFNWTYSLNRKVEQTYGGRVVQLLSTKIDDFTLKADCGSGRWQYMNEVATFLRDVMVAQRNGVPATFEYTTRGWKLNVYVVSIPFADAVEEVAREFDIGFKVQEDVSGVMSSNSLSAELSRLKDGIGFQRGQYNDPRLGDGVQNQEQGPLNPVVIAGQVVGAVNNAIGIGNSVAQSLTGIMGYPNNPFIGSSS